MVRSFSERPVGPEVVDRLVAGSLRSPTAGHARGTAWLVLEGRQQTAAYWRATTTAGWREGSRRGPGLSRAPVVALALASPGSYVARYAEEDKVGPGPDLGGDPGSWPVPYWFGDAAFCVMTLLLEATASGLGACLLGTFRGERRLLDTLGVPGGWRLFGAVLLGHPDGADHRSGSLDRPGPSRADRVHRGRW